MKNLKNENQNLNSTIEEQQNTIEELAERVESNKQEYADLKYLTEYYEINVIQGLTEKIEANKHEYSVRSFKCSSYSCLFASIFSVKPCITLIS
jgi:predicted RNase H-like nuclease (RuvC/YqgF family)